MRNIALLISYDGSNYHGFQRQANGLSIQQVLEETLQKLTGEKLTVIGSGRTDAGVHAKGQVVNFQSHTAIPVQRLPYALNSLLPRDIVVKGAKEVLPDFHARFSAKQKVYHYSIYNGKFPDVFSRRYAWHVREPLNLERMMDAAKCLLGCHDFRAFCAAGSSVKSTIRTVSVLEIEKHGQYLKLKIQADGFLYNMVRIIVGSLAEVGKGKMEPRQVADALYKGERKLAGPTAPPHGLYLVHVHYENLTFDDV